MVSGPMTEGVASETPIGSKRVGVGDRSATGKLVVKFATGDKGDKWRIREQIDGVSGMEGVSSGSGLSKIEQEISPPAVRRSANKREMLGETAARFIIRRYAGIRRVNK